MTTSTTRENSEEMTTRTSVTIVIKSVTDNATRLGTATPVIIGVLLVLLLVLVIVTIVVLVILKMRGHETAVQTSPEAEVYNKSKIYIYL